MPWDSQSSPGEPADPTPEQPPGLSTDHTQSERARDPARIALICVFCAAVGMRAYFTGIDGGPDDRIAYALGAVLGVAMVIAFCGLIGWALTRGRPLKPTFIEVCLSWPAILTGGGLSYLGSVNQPE